MAPAEPCLQWPGSKTKMVDLILNHLGNHKTYCEPYFGSGAVLLAKPRSNAEIINDADGHVINFYRVLRETPDELIYALDHTPCAEDEFHDAHSTTWTGLPPVERARRFFIRTCQGHGGPNGRWVPSTARDNLGRKWTRRLGRLAPVAERLQGVQIFNRDALEVLEKVTQESNTAIYLDPPYLVETLSYTRHYLELSGITRAHHEEMLTLALKAKGTVVISGYANQLYDTELDSWSRYEISSDHLGTPQAGKGITRPTRTEILWVNRDSSSLF